MYVCIIWSPLNLWLQSHLCITLANVGGGGGSAPDPDTAQDPCWSCICVPTHYYWSISFSAVNSVFLTFSCVCQRYVAEVLIIHFL